MFCNQLCPSGNSGWTQCSFRAGNEEFSVLARKSRACAEAYIGTPHKQARRLTPPGRKRTVSRRKLTRSRPLAGGDCREYLIVDRSQLRPVVTSRVATKSGRRGDLPFSLQQASQPRLQFVESRVTDTCPQFHRHMLRVGQPVGQQGMDTAIESLHDTGAEKIVAGMDRQDVGPPQPARIIIPFFDKTEMDKLSGQPASSLIENRGPTAISLAEQGQLEVKSLSGEAKQAVEELFRILVVFPAVIPEYERFGLARQRIRRG